MLKSISSALRHAWAKEETYALHVAALLGDHDIVGLLFLGKSCFAMFWFLQVMPLWGGGMLLDRLACTGRGCHLFCILLLIVDACQPAYSRDRKSIQTTHRSALDLWSRVGRNQKDIIKDGETFQHFRSFAASFSASGVLHIQKGEQILGLARTT